MSREKRLKESNYTHVIHPFPALYDADSKILILGSLPSVKSREQNFFYGHPQNRFWCVISSVYGCDEPHTTEEKKDFLLGHKIALWDAVASCEIEGAADSSIRGAVPNDLSIILSHCRITKIFTNGTAAHTMYRRYQLEKTGIDYKRLPSTSPANASWSLDRLRMEWKNRIFG